MNCPHCSAPNDDGARFCGSCGRATSSTEPASNPHLVAPTGEPPTLVGRVIAGRYRMLAKLGEGGMGAVYKAEQISLKRTVAVKLLRPEMVGSQLLLRRFNAEAEAVAKLNHPNTVNIYDFGQDSDGTLFIAMEFIEGQSLRSVIQRESPLPVRRALAIAAQVASSLCDAHARAIIHRDLKPDNVMIQQRGREKDIVRVLDFGIAKLRDDNRQSQMAMTQAGDMLGTPQYMAPEQIRAEAIDGRTDVYALGCLLYEMITGRLPFEAPTVMSLLSKHLLEVTVPPSARRPDLQLPPAIDHLILAAMAKDPNARPPTMEVFGEQIEGLLALAGPASVAPTGMQSAASPPYSAAMASVQTPPAYSAIHPLAAQMPAPPHIATGGLSSHAPAGAHTPPSPAATPHPPRVAPADDSDLDRVPRRSKASLWVILGVLGVAGSGAGLFLAFKKDEPAKVEDAWAVKPDPSPAPAPPDPGDDPPVPAPEPPHPGPASGGDPWGAPVAGSAPAAEAPAPPPDARPRIDDSRFTPAMQGVKIRLPKGFVVQRQTADELIAQDARKVQIVAFPITETTDDFQELSATYAEDHGLMLGNADPTTFGDHGLAVFTGMVHNQPVMHMGTALIGPGYRVGIVVQIPMTAMQQEPMIAQMPMQLFRSGISVPATLPP